MGRDGLGGVGPGSDVPAIFDQTFSGANVAKLHTSVPTNTVNTATKVWNLIKLFFSSLADRGTIGKGLNIEAQQFLTRAWNRTYVQWEQGDILAFNTALTGAHPESRVQLLTGGMGEKKNDLAKSNPATVIMNEHSRLARVAKENSESVKKDLLTYPFVYPGRPPHIVLIVADIKNKTVFYYDPQGLKADDPKRLLPPNFNMHNNLVDLAHRLFGKDGKVVQNTSEHQTDPVNCGTFVMRALKNLHEVPKDAGTRPVEDAFNFDPSLDITAERVKLGTRYSEIIKASMEKPVGGRHAYTSLSDMMTSVKGSPFTN